MLKNLYLKEPESIRRGDRIRVYLVRHGAAKKKEEDPDRPLTEKGLADVRKVARFANDTEGVKVRRIIHSGKARTRQTAEIFAEHLHPSDGVGEVTALEPHSEVGQWAVQLSNSTGDKMLVGHLPHLSRLVSQLLCQDADTEIVDFRAAGMICLERDVPGLWSIKWFVNPQMLKGLQHF